MSYDAKLNFCSLPVVPDVPVDLKSMESYRADKFPSNAGPEPWLDQANALKQIDDYAAEGLISKEEADLCQKWRRDGYVILDGFYAAGELDNIWTAYEEAIADGTIVPPPEPLFEGDNLPGRVANAHFSVPAIDGMLFEPRMSHLVSLLLGAKAAPFQTIIGHKSSQQLEHSDSIHMTTYPAGFLAANWIAFEDVHPDSGPLIFYPGSHKLPYLYSTELGIPAGSGYTHYHSIYEPAVQKVIKDHDLKAKLFLPKKGDVLIWHANLLHGGTRVNGTKSPSRKALVCHFFCEGCVCYHDLTASLAHSQLQLNLYKFDRGDLGDVSRHRRSSGSIDRVRAVFRTEGGKAVIRKALGSLKRRMKIG